MVHSHVQRHRPSRASVIALMCTPALITAVNYLGTGLFAGRAADAGTAVAVAAVEFFVYGMVFTYRIPRTQGPMGAIVPVTVIVSLMAAHYWHAGAWDHASALSSASSLILNGLVLLMVCTSIALGLRVLANPDLVGSFIYRTPDDRAK